MGRANVMIEWYGIAVSPSLYDRGSSPGILHLISKHGFPHKQYLSNALDTTHYRKSLLQEELSTTGAGPAARAL